MQRIHGPGATQDDHFQDRDVPNGIEGTEVTSDWLNAVQEELCNIVERTGGHLDDNEDDQVLQAILGLVSQGGSGAAGVGTNQVINGEFEIFQDATSAPSGVLTRVLAAGTTAYALDQWEYSCDATGGTGAATISRQPFTPGQGDVPNNPVWYSRMAQGTVANLASPFMHTKLEEVARYSGGPATWSLYAKASAALTLTMRIVQRFGSGGSSDVIVASQSVTLGTTWARYSLSTPNLPSVTGKTIGTASHLLLELVMPTGQSFTLDVADTQFEKNAAATQFQRRSKVIEADLCRRYFEKSWPMEIAAATCPASFDGATLCYSGGTTNLEELGRKFRTEKRAAPTMTWYDPPNQTAGHVYCGGASRSVTSVNDVGPASTGWPTVLANAAGQARAHWKADARL